MFKLKEWGKKKINIKLKECGKNTQVNRMVK
jgi:hypothetical protein